MMLLDLKKFLLLQGIQTYGVGLMVWHLLLNFSLTWILFPFQKHILFLFCGKRTDRIKGLVWEGDGFLLLYKRLNIGGFSWPRTKEEAMEITPEQFQMLMQGLSIVAKYPIKELKDPPKTM